jgi:hypothetical protein
MAWIDLTQERDQWRTLLKAVMNSDFREVWEMIWTNKYWKYSVIRVPDVPTQDDRLFTW